jgi:fructokinase
MKFRVVCFGEILFDVYPGYKCLGGAPFNVAFHLQHLGHEVAFVSSVGKDTHGNEIKQFMQDHAMRTEFLSINPCKKTGSVLVHLDPSGVPSFVIKEDVAYDEILPAPGLSRFIESGIDLFYFGTLAQREEVSRTTLYTLLHILPPGTIILCDINLRQHFYSRDILKNSLSVSTVVKVNYEEFLCIREMFHIKGDEGTAARDLIRRFSLDLICLTRGIEGASLYTRDEKYHTPSAHQGAGLVVDTVGAGDGFAAILGAGLLLQQPYEEILKNADHFARAICCIKGALPRDTSLYASCFL